MMFSFRKLSPKQVAARRLRRRADTKKRMRLFESLESRKLLTFDTAANLAVTSPFAVTVGDFNKDGNPDLATANHATNSVKVMLGNGAGGFGAASSFTAGTTPTAVVTKDFNGDGNPDLAAGNFSSNNVSLLLGNGAGGFSVASNFAVSGNVLSLISADFNGDGKPDLATANSSNVNVLLANGSGGFSAATGFTAGSVVYSVASGDFNGDNKVDLVTANIISNDVSLLLGNGAGSFSAPTNFSVGTRPRAVAVGDFNSDGKLDVSVVNRDSDNMSLLLGNGAGSFAAATNFPIGDGPVALVVKDFNGDGKPDVVSANFYSNNIGLLLGNGAGGFAGVSGFSTGSSAAFVAEGDFNKDGRPDVASANFTGNTVSVFLGNTPTPEIDVKGNGNSIPDGDTTPSTTDSTDFGSTAVVGGSVTTTFTIFNNGNATLNLTGTPRVTISGTNAADFTVTTQPAASVAAAGSTTFVITFDPNAVGTRSATVTIASNDLNEGTYDFAIQGTGAAVPEIDIQGNNISIADGDTMPSTADNTDFGSISVTSGSIAQTFTILNTGSGQLSLTGTPVVSISGANASDFTVTTQPASSIASGNSVTFVVTFDPSAAGTRTATITITNNDVDETVYDFAIQGVGARPEIDVQGNNNSIPDGDTTPSINDQTDFGSTAVVGGSVTRTFTILNSGNDVLNLTGTPRVSISGANASDFTVTSQPTATVAAGASATFVVTFDPSATGARTATVTVVNDDSDESTYDFVIQGVGVNTEIDVRGNNVTIDDGDSTPSSVDFTDFGSAPSVGGTVVRTFTILNPSLDTLSLTGAPRVAISGAHASDFTVTTQPAATVPGGGSTTFVVTFDPIATGTRTATITILSDDADESVYDFVIQGTGTGPEIDVQGNSVSIADGDTTPSLADYTDFGSTSVNAGTILRTFTILNTGTAPLNLTGVPRVSISGVNASDFTITTQPAASVAVGDSTSFVVAFDPSGGGTRTARINIACDDSDETTYDFIVQGIGTGPEIDLRGNNVSIVDGDTTPSTLDQTDFGSTIANVGAIARTFVIHNTGVETLNLNGNPRVVVGGANAIDFTITTQPASSVAAGGSTSFVVTFSPSTPGLRLATITIASDDPDEGTYDFSIQGTGTLNSQVTFAPASNLSVVSPYSVVVGDFNGDSKLDLATANRASNNVSVQLGKGAGGFGTPGYFNVDGDVGSIAVGDFNGDNKSDLAVANRGSSSVNILLGDGVGGFGAPTSLPVSSTPYAVVVGDFNGDGKPDIATANSDTYNQIYSVNVLLNNGTGSFQPATSFPVGNDPQRLTVGDFNRDNKLDIATANRASNNVSVLLGNGAGSFSARTNFAVGSRPQGVTVGDLNGDGKLDLVTANWDSQDISVLLGNGTGGFGTVKNFAAEAGASSVAVGDFNLDGKADIVATNELLDTVSVFVGNGAGSFAAQQEFDVGSRPSSVAVGDFNGDSKSDLVTANYYANNVTVLLNTKMANPEIDVQGNSTSIVDDDSTPASTDHTDFGSVLVAGGSVARTFTIRNTGIGTLSLNGSPRVVVSGANASDFTVTTQPSASIATAGSTTFVVTFDPTAAGMRSANISIANDDANENPFDFAIQGIGTAPEIDVQGNSTSIPDGDTLPSSTDNTDFGGTAVVGGVLSRTFTIRNSGTSPLVLSGSPRVTVDGVDAGDFTVTTQPAASVAAGGSTTFVVSFNPSAAGVRSAVITIASDDLDENPYDFVVQGTGTSPEIDIQGNGTSIVDGDTSPSTGDNTDFGSIVVASGSVVRTFTVFNTGVGSLRLNGTSRVSVSGANASEFVVTTQPVSVVAEGSSTTFVVTFTPLTVGTRVATISIANDDADENPYNFDVQGTATGVEIDVQGNSAFIIDGSTIPSTSNDTDFGSAIVASGTVTRTFTIRNLGTDDLNLTGTPRVTVTGINAADFTVTTQPAATIAAGGSTTFVVTFAPAATGIRTATVTIANNDANENPYDFSIQGAGTLSGQASNPTFATSINFALGTVSQALASADLNGDGKDDIVSANTNSLSVHLSNGLGGFTVGSNLAATGAFSVTAGDVNRDNKVDLVVVNRSSSSSVRVFLGNGAGGFNAGTNFPLADSFAIPNSVVIGDFNKDGNVDLVTANQGRNNVSLLLGNGTGGFANETTSVIGSGPRSIRVGDFNKDGNLDVVTSNPSSTSVNVLLGNGLGGFSAPINTTLSYVFDAIEVGDFNGDTYLDLVGVNGSSNTPGVYLLMGNGTGAFGTPSRFTMGVMRPTSVTVADFNGDGKLDVAAGPNNVRSVAVFSGDGTGGLLPFVEFDGFDSIFGLTTGDFSGDSKPDLAASFDRVYIRLNTSISNTAPTSVTLTPANTTLAENIDTTSAIELASIAITDDGLGTNTLSLSGTDAASFEIVSGKLRLKAGVVLDFEAKPSYSVRVNVDDTTVDTSPDAFADFTLALTNVNESPSAVALTPTSASLPENSTTTSPLVLSSISITDDGLGTNTLWLSGADANSFEIFDGKLRLRAGEVLDFETKSSYSVRVNVDDVSIGNTPDAFQDFTLTITDANEAPTSIALSASSASLTANTSTAAAIELSTITVTDDALGTNTLSLSGPEAGSFEIVSGKLRLKAGVALDAQTKPTYNVRVNVDDNSVGTTPDAFADFTLTITQANFAPTIVVLSPLTASLPENRSTALPTELSTISIFDDGFGINTLSLSGADAARFEIVNSKLYLKVGVPLNFEAKSTYSVRVNVDDDTVGNPIDAYTDFTLNVIDGNDVPTALKLTPATVSLAESASTAASTELSTIVITDDGLGTNNLFLTGTDAASFEITSGKLRLKAGVSLDFETKSNYSVRINLDDPTLGGSPDLVAAFNLIVTDVNDAPTAVMLSPSSASLAENSNTTTAIELSTIAITDDALGTNTLSLSGADAGRFEIVGNKLRLKAGVSLDFETKQTYSVHVIVDDTAVGHTPDASADFTLSITDVNDAPTAVGLSSSSTSLAENTSTVSAIDLATISVTDDALGNNTLSLSGADAASFEIVGNKLRLKAGASLDFETKPSYAVRVNVDDAAVGGTPDAFADFTLSLTNANDAPTAVSLTPSSASLPENTSTGAAIQLSTITVTDDSLGTNTFSLSGTDAASFEIVSGKLRLKAGVSLDFETKTSYSVRVNVTDTAISATPSAFADFTLSITNVTDLTLSSTSIQKGQTQRSYVRYVDLAFSNGGADLLDLISSNRITLRRYDPSGNGASVGVPMPAMSTTGRTLQLDFGSEGVGGNRSSTTGDGTYQFSIDYNGDGTADATASFYRLLGDLTGDAVVDAKDKVKALLLMGAAYSPEGDVNGDGVVNSTDLTLLSRSMGRKVKSFQ